MTKFSTPPFKKLNN